MHATGCRSVTDDKPGFWGACRRTLDWFVRPEDAARRDYKLATGRALNLTRPRDLSEKLCWLRLNYDNPLIKECRDIVTMRNYVARTVGPASLASVIAELSCARSLSPALVAGRPFEVHVTGGGGRVTVRDPGHADWNSLRSALDKRLNRTPAARIADLVRGRAPPRLLVEELLARVDDPPLEFRLWAFHGRVEMIEVADEEGRRASYYDRSLQRVSACRGETPMPSGLPRPARLDRMIEDVERLARPFPFCCIHLTAGAGQPRVRRFSFCPGGGYVRFRDDRDERYLGDLLRLPFP